MQIKVCGMTNNRNIREISLLSPEYMGFIFHENSPRDVTGKIGKLQLNTIPESVKKVAVTVNEPLEKVKKIVSSNRFDAVQLHGDEDPEYCRELMQVCMVIKAFRIGESLPGQLENYVDNCHLFLFDAKGKNRGGNGIKFNHHILKGYKLKKDFILSGGIGDADLDYLRGIKLERLVCVDLNSRFELSPGYKSFLSLKNFINKLRSEHVYK